MGNLTPPQIVAQLDKYIVGQEAAKKAVAVALRNRHRRQQLAPELSRDIVPKNILMIGPTGVGKTEIARRVAGLIEAPFVKVEATKFTEVGYVGKDVESIVHDLVEVAVSMVHEAKLREVQQRAEALAAERIVGYICQQAAPRSHRSPLRSKQAASMAGVVGGPASSEHAESEGAAVHVQCAIPARASLKEPPRKERQRVADLLRRHELDDQMIEIEVPSPLDGYDSLLEFSPGMTQEEMTETFNEFIDTYHTMSERRRRRKVSVREAQRILTREEANKLVDIDQVVELAVQRAQDTGVVFIDEIDKVCGPRVEIGADVSGEGVQRDLLPVVGGTTVMTRYGPVRTDHVLFIAAGAFYHNRPSDLIPELQGRFPLRVELAALGSADFLRILTEPANALVKQYEALLATEGVTLVFAEDGLAEIARLAGLLNERVENIGARRLHTIMEKVLEEISFQASEKSGERVQVDAAYVAGRLGELVRDEDLSRYIL